MSESTLPSKWQFEELDSRIDDTLSPGEFRAVLAAAGWTRDEYLTEAWSRFETINPKIK